MTSNRAGSGGSNVVSFGAAKPGNPLVGISQREPPTNLPAEQALLGGILSSNRALDTVAPFLEERHFADPINARVYKAARSLIESGHTADVVMLKQHFENSGLLDDVGGTAYLAQLLGAMVSPLHVGEYGRAIVACWERRRLIDLGETLVNGAFDGTTDLTAVKSDAGRQIDELLASVGSVRHQWTLGEAAHEALLHADRMARAGGEAVAGLLQTGLRSIDKILQGIEGGDLLVLAGRPGSGKSSLAAQVVLHAAGEGRQVHFYSAEMKAMQLARRALAYRAGVPTWKLRLGQHERHVRELVEAERAFQSLAVHLDDTPGPTVASITAKSRSLARKHGAPGLIVVDHLQIMAHDASVAKLGMHLAIGDSTRRMKALAKILECPIILLSQLRRPQPGMEDKRPGLPDLRQSGNIEEDADTVVFIHRPDAAMERMAPRRRPGENEDKYAERLRQHHDALAQTKGTAEILVEKSRHGEQSGTVLRFKGDTQSFVDPAENDALAGEQEGGRW